MCWCWNKVDISNLVLCNVSARKKKDLKKFKGKFNCVIFTSDFFDNAKEVLAEHEGQRRIFKVAFSKRNSHQMIIDRKNIDLSRDIASSVGHGTEQEVIDMGLDLSKIRDLLKIHQQRR